MGNGTFLRNLPVPVVGWWHTYLLVRPRDDLICTVVEAETWIDCMAKVLRDMFMVSAGQLSRAVAVLLVWLVY